jgi:hypothetical protein
MRRLVSGGWHQRLLSYAGRHYQRSWQLLERTGTELQKTYLYYKNPGLYHTIFYDVTVGNNGAPAKLGWDECTGLGTPRKPLTGF